MIPVDDLVGLERRQVDVLGRASRITITAESAEASAMALGHHGGQ